MRSEILTSVSIHITVFSDVTLCSAVGRNSVISPTLKMESGSSEMLVHGYQTTVNYVTSQKNVI